MKRQISRYGRIHFWDRVAKFASDVMLITAPPSGGDGAAALTHLGLAFMAKPKFDLQGRDARGGAGVRRLGNTMTNGHVSSDDEADILYSIECWRGPKDNDAAFVT
jgi:hypothetical protein